MVPPNQYNLQRPSTISHAMRGKPRTAVLRMVLALGIGIALIYLAFLKPVIWGGDGNEVLQVAHSLVTEQSFSILPESGGMVGLHGQSYSIRYLLLPILVAPFAAVGIGISAWLGLPWTATAAVLAVTSSVLLTAATAALVALLALRLGSTKQGAYMAALCYAFGTTALTYAQTLFSEPLLAFLIIACIYSALDKSQGWIGCSLLAMLAFLAKPTGIVIAPVISIYFLAKRYPLAAVLGPIIAPALGILLYLFYNYLRFGNPLITGQPLSIGLTASEMPQRFFGFLFGFGMGGGLIWYCPPVAMAVVGFHKALKNKPLEAIAIAGIGLSFLILHSFWFCCGWDWGPRFLVPLLPPLMALTGLIDHQSRKWLVSLSAVGFVINAPTLISFYERYYWELQTAGCKVWELSLWTSIADAPLIHAWGAAFRQISEAMTTDVSVFLAGSESITVMQIVPVWWWVLPAVGVPMWYGAIAAGLLSAAGIEVLRRGWPKLEPSSGG